MAPNGRAQPLAERSEASRLQRGVRRPHRAQIDDKAKVSPASVISNVDPEVYPWSYLGFSDEMAPLASGAFASRLNVFILTK